MNNRSEDIIRIPASIAAILGGQNGKMDELGKSRAHVLLFEDYVLKIRPAEDWDTADVQILQWLAGKAPVPQVAAHEVSDGRDWLLMTRVQGKELCKPEIMNNPALLLDCMAEALHILWSIPVDDCPFEKTVADNLSHAETAILTGCFDSSDCEPETFGPGGFDNPEALLNWLKRNLPEQDRAVVHGDFCLPNLFTDGKKFTGFIDVGKAGAGDRWMDLALGWRSLKHNSDGHYGKIYPNIHPDDLFRAAGVPKDEEKLRYYILLDELN
ncbi:MAG: aminoglycoside 3'-phosphotransferase [Clostridia bacterium]|nr:aminoglycoside 3'-phosphotransferase [Clostridia bacterium]